MCSYAFETVLELHLDTLYWCMDLGRNLLRALGHPTNVFFKTAGRRGDGVHVYNQEYG
jgi:hypothetical protein